MKRVNTLHRKSKHGVTLIIVAGVLAVLAALGASFYGLMHIQTKSALAYSDSVRAEMMAHAGIQDAVARLRALTYLKSEDPTDPWYRVNYLDGRKQHVSFPAVDASGTELAYTGALANSAGVDSDRYALHITDAGGKINVNACDNLGVVLDNLCRLIGSPLIPADLDALQPRRWATEMSAGDPAFAAYSNALNADDKPEVQDLYYRVTDAGNAVAPDGRPFRNSEGRALYGDGYAIAGYRSLHGRFNSLSEVKNALTYVERNGNNTPDDPLERLEIEAKFAALREFITLDSWVDTNTVCVGKFEWINASYSSSSAIAIDRDKSWIADDLTNDPQNKRGSLRGCYVSILNGHGAGQFRRIKTNGTDWIEVENGFTVSPGPISTYMIVAREDALLEDVPNTNPKVSLPKTTKDGGGNDTGVLEDDPDINYARYPLCIHRAPVNLNTASDKVLAALFMGLNVQHGHPMSIGTDVDAERLRPHPLKNFGAWNPSDPDWKINDRHALEAWVLTAKGHKRLPADAGKIVFDKPIPSTAPEFSYLNNYGAMDPAGTDQVNEALQLAYRIIVARQLDPLNPGLAWIDPKTGHASATNSGLARGPFKSWDDLYFRAVKPWDDERFTDGWSDNNGNGVMDDTDFYHKTPLARMIMANVNSNTDILKFNPNIEWIDRWGRNFTEMEPVMVYTNTNEPHGANPAPADPILNSSIPIYVDQEEYLKEYGKPMSGAYLVRSFRYKSDELIDKTDLNRSTTEFSFDSGGIFEIESTGQLVKQNQVLAERHLRALVKVYDVWRESTQRQFVNGIIEAPGGMGKAGTINSGQITRDGSPSNDGSTRMPLVTLPEPLVPLKYRMNNPSGLVDVVDGTRDAFGNAKSSDLPDVIANRVLPANYDGQICLATNTSGYDDSNAGDNDTFLANFDGDLDALHSKYNGREQAKKPQNSKFRVVNTFGLLGVLNDTFIDQDPDLNHAVYKFSTITNALRGLNPAYYWNNVTLRMGNLRTDGVHLTGPGCSGNTSTLKYLFGPGKENLDPGSKNGNVISMWMKPTWRHSDNRTHELFNGCNPGNWWQSRQLFLKKHGRFGWSVGDDWGGSGLSGCRARNNDLFFAYEGVSSGAGIDRDVIAQLHGGVDRVNTAVSPNESPAYRVQPFRWSFVGARWNYHYNDTNYMLPDSGGGSRGLWVSSNGGQEAVNQFLLKNYVRSFIDTQRDPEGQTSWKPDLFLTRNAMYDGYLNRPCDLANTGGLDPANGTTGQDVKYDWAAPAGTNSNKCFGVNNLNHSADTMIYRNMPEDGSYAVLDEIKISNKDTILNSAPDWGNDRITRSNSTRPGEMTLSRYYVPKNPNNRSECPTFTSQSLLQSLRGSNSGVSTEFVTVARVSWNVFTPRFMSEYKQADPNRFKRVEYHTYNMTTPNKEWVAFKGPFDFDRYNDDGDTSPYGVQRPSPPALPAQGHASKGVEVELMDGYSTVAGFENSSGLFVATGIFKNPDVVNSFHDPANASSKVSIRTDQLKYRVRFRYPVDAGVDPTGGQPNGEGTNHTDTSKQYLLDTPVFDDISITYFSRPRILDFKEVTE